MIAKSRKPFAGLIGVALSASAMAQDVPMPQQIRLVLGFPPGATTDLVARLLAQKLAVHLNTSVIAENRPGANANIAAEWVARAKPDGQTLLFNTPSIVMARAFGEKLGYDAVKDLTPVALVASSPYVLVVHPSLPAKSFAEFIALAKAHPDKLAYGSAGSLSHLAPLMFLQANRLTALHVPYKGGGPMLIDLVAGRIQFGMTGQTAVMPMVKEKRLRPLAFTALKRSRLFPDLPTLHETTMPGFEIGAWFGVMVPAGTSPAFIRRLNAEIGKSMQEPDMVARLAQEGVEALTSTPEQYQTYFTNEIERFTRLIKSAGLKQE